MYNSIFNPKVIFEQVMPPASALAFTVKKGQYFRVIDIEGKQVGDLAIFNEHDYTEKLNVAYTRSEGGVIEGLTGIWQPIQGITTGKRLISSIREPLATITADTPVPSGIHDTFFKTCCRRTRERFGLEPGDGCLEFLTKVLEPYGIAQGNIPDTFNIFMNCPYDPKKGMLSIVEPVSRPGDYIEFKAEKDLLCALTTCPMPDYSYCNGPPPHRCKPLKVQILVE